MPPPRLRPKPKSHGASALLRYLFPHTRQRARAHLSKFRHETLPRLKHRTQSRIYKYILYRQAQKLKGKQGLLQRLRGTTKRLLGSSYLENEASRRRQKLSKTDSPSPSASRKDTMSYQNSYAAREPGTRRRKFAGYLKAANELRQTYQQQYAPGWSSRETAYEDHHDEVEDPTQTAIIRSGDEEMILFPSYARKHVKKKPQAEPGTIQEVPGDGRDVRDTVGAGDAEFWKQQWADYEDDNAVVDVEVRGWVYSPHKGQMSRKQRLFIGLARQLVGIQAPPAGLRPSSSSPSPISSRGTSPTRRDPHREQDDEILTAREAEEILKKGEKEAALAAKGAYSEKPGTEDHAGLYRTQSRDSIRTTASDVINPIKKRASWNQPADMSPAELAEANTRLMARLRHFLAIPMANSPISVFFYNDTISRQRTVYTNPSGHFSISAALDFVPTHVRILASDKLSATEEIIITESQGVSVISDIDDTIKHSAISAGAREIFRNAFIRDLGDLTIDGVREWYNKMAEMGAKFHYVSNSPWQLFPVISKYFAMAGLPPGSFHLKQYSGMLQGIFEPVAERKKGTLDKIARDFPERRFILVGDSGEADLEVYTDFVLENPGRVIGVFIRDVTTTEGAGFFDSSVPPVSGDRSSTPSQGGGGSSSSKYASASSGKKDEDPAMKAAIEASLRDLERENEKRARSMFPRIEEDHPQMRPQLPARNTTQPQPTQSTGNLIDLSSDEEGPEIPLSFHRSDSDPLAETAVHRGSVKSAPPPPKKPVALRSASSDSASSNPSPPTSSISKGPPPPKPRRASSTVHQSSPLAQTSTTQTSTSSPNTPGTRKPVPPPPQTYAGKALSGLSSVYNHLPAIYNTDPTPNTTAQAPSSSDSTPGARKAPPPPPPPRRGVAAYPVAAASYVGGKAVSAWQNAPSVPHPHAPFSTTAPTNLQRTNTNQSSFGQNANGSGNQDYPAGMNKREIMWRQRWHRAEQILADDNVSLVSWRVGFDVIGETEKLIREALERDKREAASQRENDSGR